MRLKKIAVFCGSSAGNDPIFKTTAYALGKYIAGQAQTLIYGGASLGLMKQVADGVLQNGGAAIGVIPRFLHQKEIAYKALTELILTETMHERKNKIYALADGFIILPGGFGTMDELFEILTWLQLKLHQKPVGLLNIEHFYTPMLTQIDNMTMRGFVSEKNKNLLQVSNSIQELMEKMESFSHVF